MPPLGTCPNKSLPSPPGKSLDAKAPGWGQIFFQIPGGVWGMIMDEIDTCITIEFAYHMLQKLIVNKLPSVRKQF